MSICLQKSASIQRRTSPLKFNHFRYPKPDLLRRIFQLGCWRWSTPPSPRSSTSCTRSPRRPWRSCGARGPRPWAKPARLGCDEFYSLPDGFSSTHFSISNFKRSALLCIEADFDDQIRVGKLLTRSTISTFFLRPKFSEVCIIFRTFFWSRGVWTFSKNSMLPNVVN